MKKSKFTDEQIAFALRQAELAHRLLRVFARRMRLAFFMGTDNTGRELLEPA
ncbi:MAG: hypothetical protein LBC94_04200 [Desulfovibrio sp.]|jgi:hypothetical protein|nr:hypothetical protein [Desulfovibrio sp.]